MGSLFSHYKTNLFIQFVLFSPLPCSFFMRFILSKSPRIPHSLIDPCGHCLALLLSPSKQWIARVHALNIILRIAMLTDYYYGWRYIYGLLNCRSNAIQYLCRLYLWNFLSLSVMKGCAYYVHTRLVLILLDRTLVQPFLKYRFWTLKIHIWKLNLYSSLL